MAEKKSAFYKILLNKMLHFSKMYKKKKKKKKKSYF